MHVSLQTYRARNVEGSFLQGQLKERLLLLCHLLAVCALVTSATLYLKLVKLSQEQMVLLRYGQLFCLSQGGFHEPAKVRRDEIFVVLCSVLLLERRVPGFDLKDQLSNVSSSERTKS